jgi:hypothetical protein
MSRVRSEPGTSGFKTRPPAAAAEFVGRGDALSAGTHNSHCPLSHIPRREFPF